MKSQFSIDFLISLSIVLAIVAFLFLFIMPITFNNGSQQMQMYSICNYLSDSMNSVLSSYSNFSSYNLNLLNSGFTYYPYNVSISNGIIIIKYQNSIVSCAADASKMKSESFLFSNLNIYRNYTNISVAYLYGNDELGIPSIVYGGGFLKNVSLYLIYPNGTSTLLNNSLPTKFTYNFNISIKSPGLYKFYAIDNYYHNINVEFPFTYS